MIYLLRTGTSRYLVSQVWPPVQGLGNRIVGLCAISVAHDGFGLHVLPSAGMYARASSHEGHGSL